jgi:hypothetical protein
VGVVCGCEKAVHADFGAVQEAYAGLLEVDGGEVRVEALQLCRLSSVLAD